MRNRQQLPQQLHSASVKVFSFALIQDCAVRFAFNVILH